MKTGYTTLVKSPHTDGICLNKLVVVFTCIFFYKRAELKYIEYSESKTANTYVWIKCFQYYLKTS